MSWDEERKMESDFTPDKLGAKRYGIPNGWWKIDGDWYLTFSALRSELHTSKPKLIEYLKDKNVETQQKVNPYYPSRTFTVYKAEDLSIDRNPDLEKMKERVW